MCSMYWTIYADLACPKCHEVSKWELQTHFEGDVGSCINYYSLNESIEELKHIRYMTIDDSFRDAFIGCCELCKTTASFGFTVKGGKVTALSDGRITK